MVRFLEVLNLIYKVVLLENVIFCIFFFIRKKSYGILYIVFVLYVLYILYFREFFNVSYMYCFFFYSFLL